MSPSKGKPPPRKRTSSGRGAAKKRSSSGAPKRGAPKQGSGSRKGAAKRSASAKKRSSAPAKKRPSSGAPKRASGSRKGAAKRSAPAKKRSSAPAKKRSAPVHRSSDIPDVGRPDWGGVARRGAREIGRPDDLGGGRASTAWREAVESSRPEPQDEWVDLGEVRDEASGAVERGRDRRPPAPAPPVHLAREAIEGAGRALDAKTARRVERLVEDAARAFDRDRFGEARRMLQTAAELAPGSAAVHELFGLTLYRLGRWREAARELEAFRLLTGSTEQHPVLADCYRALGRHREVGLLWDELRIDSPDAATVTEGRIVAAGSLADTGRFADAVGLLEQGFRLPKRPQVFHLRRAYALADLYERAGDVPRSRDLFARIDRADPDLTDAGRRARALR